MQRHPPAQEKGGGDARRDKQVQVFGQIEETEVHAGILRVVTRRQFLFRLSQVKRPAVGLGVARDEIDDKSHQSDDVPLEDVPSVGLALHDAADAHCAAEDDHREHRDAQRQLVADEHGPAAHGTDDGVFAVAAPSGQQDAQDADARRSQHEEDAHFHVEHSRAFVPRQAREGDDGSQDDQVRSQLVEQVVGVLQADDFLGEYLQHVGRHLQQATLAAHAVRPDAALERAAHPTLHIDEHHGQHGIGQQDDDTQHQPLQEHGPALGHHAAERVMNPARHRLKAVIV